MHQGRAFADYNLPPRRRIPSAIMRVASLAALTNVLLCRAAGVQLALAALLVCS